MAIDLSSIIFRAHQAGDETQPATSPNGSGGIGINLQAIKFRAWQPPGVVVVVVGGGGGVDGGGGGVPIPGGGTTTVGVGTSPTGGAIANGAPSTTTSDNFNDGVLDPTIWNGTTETNGTITESTTLDFNLAPTGTDANLILTTLYNYSIYDSTWGFSVPSPGTSGSSWSFLFLGTNTGFRWNATTGTLTVVALDGTHDFVLGTAPTYYRVRYVPPYHQPPIIAGIVDSHKTAVSANLTVNLPNGIQTGDLLVAAVATQNAQSISGWTSLGTTASGSLRFTIFYRFVTGTEGFTGSGDSVTAVTTDTRPKVAFAYRIQRYRSNTAPQIATFTVGSSNPSAPALTPTWGLETTLWIVIAGARSATSTLVTGYPSGYTDNQISDEAFVTGDHVIHAMASKVLQIATDAASTFTAPAANWIVKKLAIRPEEDSTGTYYYETSSDGITWTTRYSEQTEAFPAEGKFQITATRTAGSGNDTVSFDNFYVIRNSPAPIVKITVPVTPAQATASIAAPLQTPLNRTITSVHASATASAPTPTLSTPGYLVVTPALAVASSSNLGSNVTIYEVVATATASVSAPAITTNSGNVDRNPPAASATATAGNLTDWVTIYEVNAAATASVIRPQISPGATKTITSVVASATANSSIHTLPNSPNAFISGTIAIATASVGSIRRPDKMVVSVPASATASVA